MRRIALDLAAQPIDVRFERVRRDALVVAPDLAKQGVAIDDAAGAVEVFEDRRWNP